MKKLNKQERDCKYLIDNPEHPTNETYRTIVDANRAKKALEKKGYKHIEIIDQYPGQY